MVKFKNSFIDSPYFYICNEKPTEITNIELAQKGEIIYWRYLEFEPVGAEELGKEFARISTYTLDDEKETNSYAGYRDWYISKYNRPGYTFETGMGQNPLPISQFEKIYKDNVGVLVTAAVKT